jgi:hypothetical protein
MGLQNSSDGKMTFVNIKQGKLVVKEKDKEPIFYTDLLGYIMKVEFKDDEYNGKHFEIAKFYIIDEKEERFCLQMRIDSGYFRGLVNSLKSGISKEKFLIKPNYQEKDGKPKTTCFVSQDGKVLKHAHTLSNMGDLPPAEKINFRGTEVWDSTKQMNYWKNWLMATDWHNPNLPTSVKEEIPSVMIEVEVESLGDDDLPF